VTGWVKAISPIRARSVAVPSPSGSSGGRWRDCRTYRGVECGTVPSGTGSIFRVESLISEKLNISEEFRNVKRRQVCCRFVFRWLDMYHAYQLVQAENDNNLQTYLLFTT
jgi:hypothetical protein